MPKLAHRVTATTLAQLIDALQRLPVPADTPVLVQGCDCYGDLTGVSLSRSLKDWTEDDADTLHVVVEVDRY